MRILTAIVLMGAILSANTMVRAADARQLFERHCAGCHGKDGKGTTLLGQRLNCQDYTAATVQASLKDVEIFKAIKSGLTKGDRTLMKPFADKFTDAEIKGLIAYIRQFKN
jgi:mono/diheme cytochrome c family protein